VGEAIRLTHRAIAFHARRTRHAVPYGSCDLIQSFSAGLDSTLAISA